MAIGRHGVYRTHGPGHASASDPWGALRRRRGRLAGAGAGVATSAPGDGSRGPPGRCGGPRESSPGAPDARRAGRAARPEEAACRRASAEASGGRRRHDPPRVGPRPRATPRRRAQRPWPRCRHAAAQPSAWVRAPLVDAPGPSPSSGRAMGGGPVEGARGEDAGAFAGRGAGARGGGRVRMPRRAHGDPRPARGVIERGEAPDPAAGRPGGARPAARSAALDARPRVDRATPLRRPRRDHLALVA